MVPGFSCPKDLTVCPAHTHKSGCVGLPASGARSGKLLDFPLIFADRFIHWVYITDFQCSVLSSAVMVRAGPKSQPTAVDSDKDQTTNVSHQKASIPPKYRCTPLQLPLHRCTYLFCRSLLICVWCVWVGTAQPLIFVEFFLSGCQRGSG